jgi:DNA-nicking Smr family endonuclease
VIEEETRIPIQDSFDLHSFLPRDVAGALSDYLDEAVRRGWREVRIIHGKGRGVRRAEVRRLLSRDSRVFDFFDAPPGRGDFGATVVLLKVTASNDPPMTG